MPFRQNETRSLIAAGGIAVGLLTGCGRVPPTPHNITNPQEAGYTLTLDNPPPSFTPTPYPVPDYFPQPTSPVEGRTNICQLHSPLNPLPRDIFPDPDFNRIGVTEAVLRGDYVEGEYNVMVVGCQLPPLEHSSRLRELTDGLRSAYSELEGIHFGWLNIPVEVETQLIGYPATLNISPESVQDLVNLLAEIKESTGRTYNQISIVAGTERDLGGTALFFAISSSESAAGALSVLVHESGHNFFYYFDGQKLTLIGMGLSDRYDPQPGLFNANVIDLLQGATWIVDWERTPEHIKNLIQEHPDWIIDSGMQCNGQVVYRINPTGQDCDGHVMGDGAFYDPANQRAFCPYEKDILQEAVNAAILRNP